MRIAYDLQPDAVVVDVRMPALDGLAVIPLLRRGVPGATIAVLSAWRDPSVRRRALHLGADAYVAKSGVTALAETLLATFGR